MNNRNIILRHSLFCTHYQEILHDEKDRIFCRHDINHFLSVARIAMILNVTEKYNIDEEIIYATALLHDIGRHEQYKTGVDHAAASTSIAKNILNDCTFSSQEKKLILTAISCHSDKRIEHSRSLYGLIYRADKLSRNCFCCEVYQKCKWTDEKKCRNLIY